jgi:hypothetical protein
MEGSLVAYKVFTNGSVLNASEINDNLMNQSVMVFSNAAARTAALTSPVDGMVTFLEDTDAMEIRKGGAFLPVGGLNLISSVSFSAVASQSLNNVFSSNYDNYKIVFKATKSTTSSIDFRFRVGGVDNTSAIYSNASVGLPGTSTPTGTASNTTALVLVPADAQSQFTDMTIYSPNLAETTGATSISLTGGYSTATQARTVYSRFGASTVIDGFSIIASAGTISGLVQVYGYGKS